MIELLGVGVPRRDRGWLLHRVCVTLEAGELTTVLADVEERRALLDVITGRRLPDEGRVWIDRVPVMPDSLSRIRRLCADIGPHDRLVARRSVFWNALTPASGLALGRLLRLPQRRERAAVEAALERAGLRERIGDPAGALSTLDRLRLRVARALAQRTHNLVLRDPDASLSADEVGILLALVRLLARTDRLGAVVSLATGAGQQVADRVLLLHEGLLLFHGPPDAPGRPAPPWWEAALAR